MSSMKGLSISDNSNKLLRCLMEEKPQTRKMEARTWLLVIVVMLLVEALYMKTSQESSGHLKMPRDTDWMVKLVISSSDRHLSTYSVNCGVLKRRKLPGN